MARAKAASRKKSMPEPLRGGKGPLSDKKLRQNAVQSPPHPARRTKPTPVSNAPKKDRRQQKATEITQVDPEVVDRKVTKRLHDVSDFSSTERTSVKRTKTTMTAITLQPAESPTAPDPHSSDKNIVESQTSNEPKALGALDREFSLSYINIDQGTHIQFKVRRIMEALSQFSLAKVPARPNVVVLCAKKTAAAKLISIIEIAKRELDAQGLKWFQYNRVEAVVEEKAVAVGDTQNPAEDLTIEELEESALEETQFETMKTPLERACQGCPKLRASCFMTTYLSRVRIDFLKNNYE